MMFVDESDCRLFCSIFLCKFKFDIVISDDSVHV